MSWPQSRRRWRPTEQGWLASGQWRGTRCGSTIGVVSCFHRWTVYTSAKMTSLFGLCYVFLRNLWLLLLRPAFVQEDFVPLVKMWFVNLEQTRAVFTAISRWSSVYSRSSCSPFTETEHLLEDSRVFLLSPNQHVRKCKNRSAFEVTCKSMPPYSCTVFDSHWSVTWLERQRPDALFASLFSASSERKIIFRWDDTENREANNVT